MRCRPACLLETFIYTVVAAIYEKLRLTKAMVCRHRVKLILTHARLPSHMKSCFFYTHGCYHTRKAVFSTRTVAITHEKLCFLHARLLSHTKSCVFSRTVTITYENLSFLHARLISHTKSCVFYTQGCYYIRKAEFSTRTVAISH